MRVSHGASREVAVADLDKSLPAEARFVPTVHDRDRQIAEPPHRRAVGSDVGSIELVEERAVVHGVAGEQDACRGFPETDASG